jgi:hypothetical protein
MAAAPSSGAYAGARAASTMRGNQPDTKYTGRTLPGAWSAAGTRTSRRSVVSRPLRCAARRVSAHARSKPVGSRHRVTPPCAPPRRARRATQARTQRTQGHAAPRRAAPRTQRPPANRARRADAPVIRVRQQRAAAGCGQAPKAKRGAVAALLLAADAGGKRARQRQRQRSAASRNQLHLCGALEFRARARRASSTHRSARQRARGHAGVSVTRRGKGVVLERAVPPERRAQRTSSERAARSSPPSRPSRPASAGNAGPPQRLQHRDTERRSERLVDL